MDKSSSSGENSSVLENSENNSHEDPSILVDKSNTSLNIEEKKHEKLPDNQNNPMKRNLTSSKKNNHSIPIIPVDVVERKLFRRSTIDKLSGMPINEIKPPCSYDQYSNCDQCNKKPLSLEDFKETVDYQIFKLGSSIEEGMTPLGYSRRDEEISCDFLKKWFNKTAECKFLIVVAMYNEDCHLADATLKGIMNNLKHFFIHSERPIKPEHIGVVFLIDGIEPFLRTVQRIEGKNLNQKKCFTKNHTYFSQFFNLDVIKETLFTKDVLKKEAEHEFEIMKNLTDSELIYKGQEICHVFSQKIKYGETYSLNTIYCVKQLNKKKLNTHLWFFEGFCSRIDPKYVMLLDVGTIPMEKGLFYLYEAMENDSRIAGCCGEIAPICETWNPIVQAQVVEYKFSHIMDKGLESIIGYVSVLPGAFSAYRWDRIRDDEVLGEYFFSQKTKTPMDLFKSNMYLAEDRILCLELMCQKGQSNILRYVRESIATTDVPEQLNELMAQRRRWINGSWFSMIYTIRKCNRIGNSNHSCLRKLIFKALMVYYFIIALFNWVLVGAFYLAFTVAVKRNLHETEMTQDRLTKASTPLIFFYGCILVCIVITSFTVKPRKVEGLYKGISFVLGLYTYVTIFLTLYFIFGNNRTDKNTNEEGFTINDKNAWVSQMSAVLTIVAALMFTIIILINFKSALKPVVKGVLSFLFLTGTYVNLFMIYAICNIHDCSWGNRPDKQTPAERAMVDEYRTERTKWVIVWVFCNSAFAYFLNIINSSGDRTSQGYITILAVVVYFMIALKFVGGVLYYFDEWCCCCFHKKSPHPSHKSS